MLNKILRFLSKIGATILRIASNIYKHGCAEVNDMKEKARLFTKQDLIAMFKGQASYFFLAAALTQAPAAWRKTLAWINLPYTECVEPSEDGSGVVIKPLRTTHRFLTSTFNHVFDM